MVLLVTERCAYELNDSDYIETGTRTYCYEVANAKTLEDAIQAFNNSFDSKNLFNCNDNFEGPCLDSYVQDIVIYEK